MQTFQQLQCLLPHFQLHLYWPQVLVFPSLIATPSLSLEGKKTEELENPGSDIEETSETVLNRIEVLNRTKEETNKPESVRGCILTQNLTKQIQRRRLQLLDSLQVPSREVSVIRCSSTPDPKNCREHFSFGGADLEASQPSSFEPPFQVYIDNPSEFYSLQTPLSPHPSEEELPPSHISLVSTDESDLNMTDNENAKQELERKFLAKSLKFGSVLRLYESSKYPKEVLAAKEKEWTAAADEQFHALVDSTDELYQQFPNLEKEIEEMTKKYTDVYQKWLSDYQIKILSVNPSNQSSQNSSAAAEPVNTEKAKHAQVEVNLDSEMIRDGVKELSNQFKKVTDWTAAESHVIESSMSKVAGWRDEFKNLKAKLYSVKKNTQCYDLDNNNMSIQSIVLVLRWSWPLITLKLRTGKDVCTHSTSPRPLILNIPVFLEMQRRISSNFRKNSKMQFVSIELGWRINVLNLETI